MISGRLRELMNKRNLTMEHLSFLSDVPVETIRNILYNRAVNPRIYTVQALCRALHVSVENILGDEEKAEEQNLLAAYRNSGRRGRKLLQLIAGIEAECEQASKLEAERQTIPCLIPPVRAVDGFDVYNACGLETVETSSENAYLTIRIPNDQYAPCYCKNDIVLLAERDPTEGENVVFIHDRRVYLRRFHRNEKCYIFNAINGDDVSIRFNRMNQCKLIGTCLGVL